MGRSREEATQDLVDALSDELGRAVLLDDPELTPLAYSRQWRVDAVRSASILERGTSDGVKQALAKQAIAEAEGLIRTPPRPDLGMDARICAPVRDESGVLGYVWILDAAGDLGPAGLESVRRTVRALVAALAADEPAEPADLSRLIAALRSPDATVRTSAAAEVERRLPLDSASAILCLVAAVDPSVDPVAGVGRATRRLSDGQAIAAPAPEGAAVIVCARDPVLSTLPSAEIANWVRVASGERVAVGQSDELSLTAFDEASRRAGLALRVARSRGGDAAAAWATLGADRLLAQLPPGVGRDLPEPLARLLRDEPELAATLATYLDRGGEVKATATALSLHRNGLYYRLRRIEQLAGIDLDRGEDRLLAQLALRTVQMP